MGQREFRENSIRVLLIDDEADIRNIVNTLLYVTEDIDMVGTGVNGLEALAMCEELRPDILLLDVMMPVMDGIEAAGLLRERFPDLKILVFSSIHDYESIQSMLKNKVNGYVDKSNLFKKLAADIRAAYGGSMVFSPKAFAVHLSGDAEKNKTSDFGLTKREKEILKLMAAGLSMPAISAELTIGLVTVRTHIENIIKKFGVKTRAEALILAAKNKLT
jgi:NarL family two-component system response regulator LiaR